MGRIDLTVFARYLYLPKTTFYYSDIIMSCNDNVSLFYISVCCIETSEVPHLRGVSEVPRCKWKAVPMDGTHRSTAGRHGHGAGIPYFHTDVWGERGGVSSGV